MASPTDASEMSPVKRALIELKSLRARVAELEQSSREPLAIVGMAARFPGAPDTDSFWRLLAEGRCAISEVPRDRWEIERYFDSDPAAPGKTYSRHAGFLDRVDEFDAGFFGIHPREAVTMDPQQRLLLEVAWEALENAAQSPDAIAGTAGGVFLGMAGSDYLRLLMAEAERIDAYTGTGASASIAAGRLSYLLGLEGPSVVVDTACSSSLVAVHMACQSLRNRECNLALAGGVNLILTPENTLALSKARMLAPDGLCKAFDESADGFVRAEGCGILVLKRLADAQESGDYIHAVIRGSAVNQDGRSGGLTVPSGPAQEAVIRAALADARIDPADIAYVEAHGTGTSLGDPIEVHALVSALCAARDAGRPLFLGSAKTNIGHLEAAAGVAGMIKAVLALQRNQIPPHLHFKKLNPHIDLRGAPISIPTAATPWPSSTGRRAAGVSSFGFSGTNAHVIVEAAPAREPARSESGRPHALALSARSPRALRETARRWAACLETRPDLSLEDVCFTAMAGRKRFEHRATWTAASLADLRGKLEAFAGGGPCDPWQDNLEPPIRGRRIPLPTYPFERSRYWIESAREDPWGAATEAGRTRSLQISAELHVDAYEGKWRSLRAVVTASIVDALRELGASLGPGEKQTAETLLAQTGALPGYGRLLARWLKHLAGEGLLACEPDGVYTVGNVAAGAGRDEALAQAAKDFEDDGVILEYVARCGRQLAAILSGKQSPLETLFPNGDFSLAERLYQDSPLSRYFNSIAASTVAAASRARTKSCRILELGAGTGATSSALLPLLPAGADYCFTDVSGVFLSRAQRKFAAHPFVRYGLLDIERDPAAQGYAAGGFDVVVATNVLHATADLRQALAHVRSLLAPSGVLVLSEATEYLPWFDITTALIEGWQRYNDGLRGEHPLLTAQQWNDALRAAGFTDVRAFPEEGAATEILGQHVLVSLAPASAPAAAAAPVAAPASGGFLEKLKTASPADRRTQLLEFVRGQLAAVLGHDSPAALSGAERLMDLGLDSLMALELRANLERGLDLDGRLSSTLVFDFPTVEAVAEYLEREIAGGAPAPAGLSQNAAAPYEPLAIIGAACRLPGGADDLDSFWSLLASGTDAIGEVPRDRWNIADWYDPDPDTPGKMATRWGGFIGGVDQFDPEFFGISPREAESMDPQQRLLLEVSWEALENAAQHPARLAKSRTGVFVGITSDDYSRLLSSNGDLSCLDTYYASGVARSVAAGRIAYVLGLQGPNVSLDTACSSSLVAVHQACQSLRAGECRLALAGGANVMLIPHTTVALSRAHMMAPDGRCKAFDDRADGFVRAEGCVMVALKRLTDAVADGDRIIAVVRGSAVNQDGKSSGLTVPNGPAQEAVIRLALTDAGVAPGDVDYVETHGTGTSLGDPIEAHALAAAFGQGRAADAPLRIGSVKTNIGHLESAAGAAGLLKAALALYHEEIPPQLHFRKWNRNIDLKGANITVPVERTPWKAGARPRIAGVSSFGFSGTNAHIVLEEAPLATPPEPESGPRTLRLSARSDAALRRLAERYCAFFDAHPGVSLAGVCYTAAACRVAFPCRLEATAEDVDEMRRKLAEAAEAGAYTHAGPAEPPAAEPPARRKVALPLSPFERRRYWRPKPHARNGEHPLLSRRVLSPALSQTVFEAAPRDWPDFLADHCVRGKAVLPMAAYLEIFMAASGGQALEDVLIREPLELQSGGAVQVVVDGAKAEIFSRDGETWKLHGSARLAKPGERPAPADLAGLRARVPRNVDPRAHYALLRERGIEFGPAFRLVEELWAGDGEALGRVSTPAEARAYRAHPAMLDAWIQALTAAVGEADGLYLPLGLDRFELFEQPAGELWSFASLRPGAGDTLTADISVLDGAGRVVAVFEALRLRRTASRRLENPFYEIVWRTKERAAAAPPAPTGGAWLVFADAQGTGAAVAAGIEKDGGVCRTVRPGDPFQALLQDPELRGVVHLWSLDAAGAGQVDVATLRETEREICGSVLEIARALAARDGAEAPRLYLATRGAQAVVGDREEVSAAQAPLWGMARSIRLEHPEFRCVTVDLDPHAGGGAEKLLDEIRLPDGETQVAWRGGRRLAARLARTGGDSVRLDITARGSLENLKLGWAPRRRPGRGEVEIRVAAAGLNFRDVLNALGEYRGELGPLGSECAGRITEVGEGVTGLKAGDQVVGIARGSLASHTIAPADLVAPKPDGLSMEEAATIPVAYMTARYALLQIGRLKAGERVLIHAAAGGVGLAAVAEARRAGAEVFATAGSEEKRAYLRSLGVAHVMSSRTLDFGREVMERTGGSGVDVALNSLAGEFVAENLRVLATGGRYLEIGKKGIWEASRVAERRPDVRYSVIDWGQEYERAPQPVATIFGQLMRDAAAGLAPALPYKRFAMPDAIGAFRWMAQARHIGKIVLTPLAPCGDGLYLITGGTGGLGLRVATRLIDRGARDLLLVARSAPGPEARRTIRLMEERGARVTVRRADVSQPGELETVFEEIAKGGTPLKGVVHAAGILADGVLAQQDWERFAAVLAPKVEGTWRLHQLTAGMDLDFFVMFSSMASVLGSPGQANHAAANSFMDALAHYRRWLGLPAVSVNWGPWSEVGAAAGEKASTHLAGRGIGFLAPEQGLDVFELALMADRAQFAAAPVDWREAQKTLRIDAAYLSEIAGSQPQAACEAGPVAELAATLARTEPPRRSAVLLEEVRRRACNVLGLDPERAIDPDLPLSDLGLDSLMAIELRNSLSAAMGRPLPSTLIFSYPSTAAIAEYLGGQVLEAQVPEAGVEAAADEDDMLARLESLSDSEVERMLEEASERIS